MDEKGNEKVKYNTPSSKDKSASKPMLPRQRRCYHNKIGVLLLEGDLLMGQKEFLL